MKLFSRFLAVTCLLAAFILAAPQAKAAVTTGTLNLIQGTTSTTALVNDNDNGLGIWENCIRFSDAASQITTSTAATNWKILLFYVPAGCRVTGVSARVVPPYKEGHTATITIGDVKFSGTSNSIGYISSFNLNPSFVAPTPIADVSPIYIDPGVSWSNAGTNVYTNVDQIYPTGGYIIATCAGINIQHAWVDFKVAYHNPYWPR